MFNIKLRGTDVMKRYCLVYTCNVHITVTMYTVNAFLQELHIDSVI